MEPIIIRGELAQRLSNIAAREHRPVEDVLWAMYGRYIENNRTGQELRKLLEVYEKKAAETSPLEAFLGMIDSDITDASTTVRETMEAYYRNKYSDKQNNSD